MSERLGIILNELLDIAAAKVYPEGLMPAVEAFKQAEEEFFKVLALVELDRVEVALSDLKDVLGNDEVFRRKRVLILRGIFGLEEKGVSAGFRTNVEAAEAVFAPEEIRTSRERQKASVNVAVAKNQFVKGEMRNCAQELCPENPDGILIGKIMEALAERQRPGRKGTAYREFCQDVENIYGNLPYGKLLEYLFPSQQGRG